MGLRALSGDELPLVVALEQTLHPTPWSATQFADSMAGGHALWAWDEPGGAGDLAAYAVTQQVLDEAHLLNLSVRRESQRRGIGRALLDALISTASAQGARRMFLEVRAGNTPARALYGACGFVEVGRRKGYYAAAADAPREDAVVMVREIVTHG